MIRKYYVKRCWRSRAAVWLGSGAVGVIWISVPSCLTENGLASILSAGSSSDAIAVIISQLESLLN